ncbi:MULTISPECIES: molybdenum cofactor guanylyltransferase [Brevibacterium]|nr:MULTISPECIES: NTP transferase domain-containing protein [Brevibacterium]
MSAVILSGGRSSRFGGVHKPGVTLGGRTVISRLVEVAAAVEPGTRIWLAGTAEGLDDSEIAGIDVVVEQPRFSGPLAAIAAAVTALEEPMAADIAGTTAPADPPPSDRDTVLVLAGDMPLLTVAHLRELVAASRRSGTVAAGLDDRGRVQYLCAAWPRTLLDERLRSIGDPRDKPVRLLFEGVQPVSIAVDPTILRDFDTPEEFAGIERLDGDVERLPIRPRPAVGGSSD